MLATVLYLYRDYPGGTDFFRHSRSGFESITEERKPFYQLVTNRERDSVEAATGSRLDVHPCYERIARVRLTFNSMFVYPGCLLHNGDIAPDLDLPLDPRSGRYPDQRLLVAKGLCL